MAVSNKVQGWLVTAFIAFVVPTLTLASSGGKHGEKLDNLVKAVESLEKSASDQYKQIQLDIKEIEKANTAQEGILSRVERQVGHLDNNQRQYSNDIAVLNSKLLD